MYVLSVRDVINNKEKKDKLIMYLKKHGFDSIEEDILKNMVFLYYEDVFGTISFEIFGKIALLRYFIYSDSISFSNVKKMFKNLCNNISYNKCEKIMCICDDSIKDVFIELGFNHLEEDLVFIDELSLSKSNNYKNKKAYIFSLNSV